MKISKRKLIYEFGDYSFVRVDLITRIFVEKGDKLIFYCQGTKGRTGPEHKHTGDAKIHYQAIVDLMRESAE